jgi:hypothetical protein
MALWESRFKGEHISAAEMGERRPTFTIARITTLRMDDEKKKREVDKPAIWFKEIERSWLYCKTSGHSIAAMFGKDDSAWIGKRITLYADPDVRFGSEQVGGIRVAGSPDIEKEIKIRVKFPKKKPIEIVLTPTAAPATTKQAQKSAPDESNAPIT